jgi:hypothetical protein
MQAVILSDVHVYEARSNYWAGKILKDISGADLYNTSFTERPWSITIHCKSNGNLHSVEFENGAVWSFAAMKDYHVMHQWPLFLSDFPSGTYRARVSRIFSDSFSLDISSENAVLNDLLVWRYSPRGGKNGLPLFE